MDVKTARRLIPTKFNLSRLSNEQAQCSAHGCQSLRDRISKHCKAHEVHHKYWGDPIAPAVRSTDYRREREEVAALFADPANVNHPGLVKVTEYVQGLMDEAKVTEGQGFKGAEELERLRIRGTKAGDIVVAGVALRLYLQRTGKGGTLRREQFLMAHAVFGLQPRERRYAQVWPPVKRTVQQSFTRRARTSALAHVGALLTDAFVKIAVMAVHAIETKEERKAAAEAALSAPFK